MPETISLLPYDEAEKENCICVCTSCRFVGFCMEGESPHKGDQQNYS